MESLRRFNHGSKGGGGRGGRKLESGGGGGGRKLERRFAAKHIDYEHTRPRRGSRSDSESSYDESESSHSREDPYVFDEFRVMGKASVDEMNEVCRYLGFSAPDAFGIAREDWNANKIPPTSHVVIDADSASITQEDPSDFTFPHPSYLATSPQGSYGDPIERVSDTGVRQSSGNYGVSTSTSTFKNDADAAYVGNSREQHQEPEQERVQERQSHRFPFGWRERSVSLPATQNRSFRTPSSLVLAGTPRPLLGDRIFEYPDGPDPVTHIHRAQSQPVSLTSDMLSSSVEACVVGEEKVKGASVQGSNNVSPKKSVVQDRDTVVERSADPASVRIIAREDPVAELISRREGDSSSRSSSGSDGSGEYSSNYSGREPSRSPEQSSFEKVAYLERAKVVAYPMHAPLSRPPPMAISTLPSDAYSTHDLLGGLGPPDSSVAVVGKQNSKLDSEDDELPLKHTVTEAAAVRRWDTDDASLGGRNGKPEDPFGEVHDGMAAIAVTPPDAKKATEVRAPIDDRKDIEEVESNGERRNPSLDVQESTTSPTEQIMKLTQDPVEEVEEVRPLITFPWNKGDLLGAGSFGTVYEAFDSNGCFFAVKEVSLTETDKNSLQCISQLEQEIELLSRFRHENIVQYLGFERADGKLYIFLELVSKGSLASLCKKFSLTHSQIIAYTRQILKGLKYLHDMNIVHRDIKCANILVDVHGTCKLADFGLAKQISALDQLKSCKGSAYWMAPEVIDPKKTYWLPADIWSLGCSVLEMFTGSPPYGDQEWYRVLWKVGHGEAPPIPEELSEDAKDFIGQCLEVNPSKRPTATALLQHRFVATSGTPTNSGQLNPQLVVSSLQTITEERTADFMSRTSGTYRSSLGDSPLSNGHSGH